MQYRCLQGRAPACYARDGRNLSGLCLAVSARCDISAAQGVRCAVAMVALCMNITSRPLSGWLHRCSGRCLTAWADHLNTVITRPVRICRGAWDALYRPFISDCRGVPAFVVDTRLGSHPLSRRPPRTPPPRRRTKARTSVTHHSASSSRRPLAVLRAVRAFAAALHGSDAAAERQVCMVGCAPPRRA